MRSISRFPTLLFVILLIFTSAALATTTTLDGVIRYPLPSDFTSHGGIKITDGKALLSDYRAGLRVLVVDQAQTGYHEA